MVICLNDLEVISLKVLGWCLVAGPPEKLSTDPHTVWILEQNKISCIVSAFDYNLCFYKL